MKHNPNNKECARREWLENKGFLQSPDAPCTCTTPQTDHIGKANEAVQPTSDWAQRWFKHEIFYSDKIFNNVERENARFDFIEKEIAQAKEEGRREASNNPLYTTTPDGVRQISCDGCEQSRLATITLFEEWHTKWVDSYKLKYQGMGMTDSILAVSEIQADLLAFAEKIKANTSSHD